MTLAEFLWRAEALRPGSLPDLASRVPPPPRSLVGDPGVVGLVAPWPLASFDEWLALHEIIVRSPDAGFAPSERALAL